jgi:hypothetical protein
MNGDVTRIHLAASSNTRTSGTAMTSVTIHCHLEASDTWTTSGITSAYTWALPCKRLGARASLCGRLDPAKEVKVCCDPYCRVKVPQDPISEVELRCWNLHGLTGPHPQ